jgi:hypothetical protein
LWGSTPWSNQFRCRNCGSISRPVWKRWRRR